MVLVVGERQLKLFEDGAPAAAEERMEAAQRGKPSMRHTAHAHRLPRPPENRSTPPSPAVPEGGCSDEVTEPKSRGIRA